MSKQWGARKMRMAEYDNDDDYYMAKSPEGEYLCWCVEAPSGRLADKGLTRQQALDLVADIEADIAAEEEPT
jgi:hypothetical protein